VEDAGLGQRVYIRSPRGDWCVKCRRLESDEVGQVYADLKTNVVGAASRSPWFCHVGDFHMLLRDLQYQPCLRAARVAPRVFSHTDVESVGG
jgi:hypothetical protein